jgi:hypothetical protein
VRRGRAHRAGPDEDDIRHRPKQAHDESIGIEEPADLAAAGAAVDVERDNAVEGRDEVRDDGRSIRAEGDAELAVVLVAQARRQSAAPAAQG